MVSFYASATWKPNTVNSLDLVSQMADNLKKSDGLCTVIQLPSNLIETSNHTVETQNH
jgi:hypothetical protein